VQARGVTADRDQQVNGPQKLEHLALGPVSLVDGTPCRLAYLVREENGAMLLNFRETTEQTWVNRRDAFPTLLNGGPLGPQRVQLDEPGGPFGFVYYLDDPTQQAVVLLDGDDVAGWYANARLAYQ
jgi:hypothetical protein